MNTVLIIITVVTFLVFAFITIASASSTFITERHVNELIEKQNGIVNTHTSQIHDIDDMIEKMDGRINIIDDTLANLLQILQEEYSEVSEDNGSGEETAE